MPKQSKTTWEMARSWYERKGLSQKAIADKLGVAEGSVHNHVKKEGWVKGNETPGPVPDKLVKESTAEKLAETERRHHEELAKLRAEIDSKDLELVEARALTDEYKPTADIRNRIFTDPSQVEDYFGEARLRDMAERELSIENQKRWRDGLPPLRLEEEAYQASVKRIALELVADRTKWVSTEGPQMRVMKMVKPDEGKTIVQIPVENQINNQAGSIGDGVQLYKNKGYKICDPFLCAMKDCWEFAHVDGLGRFTYEGYCNLDHRNRTEQRQGSNLIAEAVGA